MLRYIAHGYFMHQSLLRTRGLEPARAVNSSHISASDILSKQAPSRNDTVLEGRYASNGFTMDDAIELVATKGQRMFDSDSSLLATTYKQQHKFASGSLSHKELSKVIESYTVHWRLGMTRKVSTSCLIMLAVCENSHPHWRDITSFAEGIGKEHVVFSPTNSAARSWVGC